MQFTKLTPTTVEAIRLDEVISQLQNPPPDLPEWVIAAIRKGLLVLGLVTSRLYEEPYAVGGAPTMISPLDWIIWDGRSVYTVDDGTFENEYSSTLPPPPILVPRVDS